MLEKHLYNTSTLPPSNARYFYCYNAKVKKIFTLLAVVTLVVVLPIVLLQFSNTTFITNVAEAPTEYESYEKLNLQEKVGQLFLIGHWSETVTSDTTKLIDEHYLGGVIVMDSPNDPRQIKSQVDVWQNASYPTPLIIGIDQEGGLVSRLKDDDYVQTPQPQITTVADAYDVSHRRAQALRTLGINTNFAPVMDQSTKPESFMYERVFREPSMIAGLSDAMIRGYQNNDIIAVPKHYPGHPDTADDSHLVLPILTLTKEEYENSTNAFKEVIQADNVQMLMTAHMQVPALDDTYPATLSPTILNDLRNRIGFDGVVITDDLAMQAISNTWTYEESAVLALKAGADMIMLAAEPEVVGRTIEAVLDAIESGDLSEERIDEAYERVMQVKDGLN